MNDEERFETMTNEQAKELIILAEINTLEEVKEHTADQATIDYINTKIKALRDKLATII